MNWRTKAAIQNAISTLPSSLGYAAYYSIQRLFGGLRETTPTARLRAGAEVARRLSNLAQSLTGKTVLEVGTGRRINVPLGLWLCGAEEIVTVDLNPYLKPELVVEDILYIRAHEEEVRDLFKGIPQHPFCHERFRQLLACNSLDDLLSLAQIRYLAPADASALPMKPESIDYHVSYTVLEHIPPPVLKSIFIEGKRLLRPNGLFVHSIDFSDHFAHSDDSISSVNFLQFSESEWERLAGNRYMYQNRLRMDEFQELLTSVGLRIQSLDTKVDERSLVLLKGGFPLDVRFQGKDPRTNATIDAWVVASLQ